MSTDSSSATAAADTPTAPSSSSLTVERPQGRTRGATHSACVPPRPQPLLAAEPPGEVASPALSGATTSSSAAARKARPPPPSPTGDKLRFSLVSATDALQGRRNSMEDSHISIDDLSRHFPDTFLAFQQRGVLCAFYGIYDGHVGKRASTFVSDVLHDRICRQPAFQSLLSPQHDEDGSTDAPVISEEVKNDVIKAIEEGFLQTDREFIEDAVKVDNKWKDGTTAVTALLLDSQLFLANLGDSEALLGKREYDHTAGEWRESFEVLSELHKPTMPSERSRIEKEGGFIVGGRVGGLSVSRSFGDRNMKLPVEEDGFWHGVLVDPHPYITHRQLTSAHSFLLLGCDGVWENWSHQESVDFIFEKLDEGMSVDDLTEAITKKALAQGSMDNISATLILFKWESS